MDTVVDRLEFCRFVDDILGRGDFAAIMKPARDFERFPVLIRKVKLVERRLLGFAGRLRQQACDLRHALAMPAGVGRFRIDRTGDQLDEGAQQCFLHVQKLPAFQRHCCETGKRPYETQAGFFALGHQFVGLSEQQRQQADMLVVSVDQWQGDHG